MTPWLAYLPLLRPFFPLCRWKVAGAVALAITALSLPYATAAPYQVRDINRTAPAAPRSTTMYFLASMDSVSFFSVSTEAEGYELWRSDGTPAGTELVRDIYPGRRSSYPGPAVVHQGLLYFAAEDPEGDCLWRSDGTAEGTWPVLRTAVLPSAFAVLGDTLLFVASFRPESGPAYFTLWKSDGTAGGTVPLGPVLDHGRPPHRLVAAGSLVYFVGASAGSAEKHLWKSDGTSAGTVPLTSGGEPVPTPATASLFESDGTIYFNTSVNNQYMFWRSDGTDSGTTNIRQLAVYPDQITGRVAALNGVMYFAGWDGTGGIELWRSDGTASGTWMIKDIYPGSTGSAPWGVTAWQGQLFFSASESSFLRKLWRSDRTAEGTRVIPGPEFSQSNGGSLTLFNNTLYAVSDMSAGFRLWRSDGTDEGTTLARELFSSPTVTNVNIQAATSGTMYLTASDGVVGTELWKTDGTPGSAALVRNISPEVGNSSSPGRLTALDGTLYFAAQDEASGRELWKSDGSDSGTALVADLYPGAGSFFLAPTMSHTEGQPLAANGFLYFYGFNGTGGWDLFRSNGTAAGTILVRDFGATSFSYEPDQFTLSGEQIFFASLTYLEGIELWKTDGTTSGTEMVKDIVPGFSSGPGGSGGNSSSPRNLTDVAGRLFFTAAGDSLWMSDGTDAGTERILWPGAYAGNAGALCRLGPTLLFVSNGGVYGNHELWKVDQGTSTSVQVSEIRSGTSGAFLGPGGFDGDSDKMVAGNGIAWFAAHDGTEDGLWKTDGTAAGTVLIKGFGAGRISRRSDLFPAGPWLYFGADDGVHGMELWRSDGTEAGTNMVVDLSSGPAGSYPEMFCQPVPGGPVVFLACDGTHGNELWRTFGTAASTSLLTDIAPGPRSSDIATPVASGSHLFFPAGGTDRPGGTGVELWAIPLSDITAAEVPGEEWSLYE